MSRIANTNNMTMKVRYWSKTTPMYLTIEDGDTCESPTLIDKSLKFCFKSGYREIIKSLLESLIFHTRISEIHNVELSQLFQSILTFKWNVELGVIRVDVIANIMVSKCRTKWKQIQTKFHWSQNWVLWHPTQQTCKIRHNTINLNSLITELSNSCKEYNPTVLYDHKNMTEFAVVHYHQFRHISQVCRINYHDQSCRRQRINPEERLMIHCPCQRL